MAEAFIPYGAGPRAPKISGRDEMNARIRAARGPGESLDNAMKNVSEFAYQTAAQANAQVSAEQLQKAELQASKLASHDQNKWRLEDLKIQEQWLDNAIAQSEKDGDLQGAQGWLLKKQSINRQKQYLTQAVNDTQNAEWYKEVLKRQSGEIQPDPPWQTKVWDRITGKKPEPPTMMPESGSVSMKDDAIKGIQKHAGLPQTGILDSETVVAIEQIKQNPNQPMFAEGTSFDVTSGYGARKHPTTGEQGHHNGLDLGTPIGTPLLAPEDAIVEEVGYNNKSGHYIIMRLDNGHLISYAHLNERPSVGKGTKVRAGTLVANSGKSGVGTGPHLHLVVKDSAGNEINPESYFTRIGIEDE